MLSGYLCEPYHPSDCCWDKNIDWVSYALASAELGKRRQLLHGFGRSTHAIICLLITR